MLIVLFNRVGKCSGKCPSQMFRYYRHCHCHCCRGQRKDIFHEDDDTSHKVKHFVFRAVC